MGLLERFEDSLDRLVNGAFARAFKAEVQPVEIAAALQREVDDRAAVIDRERTVIPNVFFIELSEHDFNRLAPFQIALQAELAALIRDYGAQQRYTILGTIEVSFGEDEELDTGIFRVRSEARAEIRSGQESKADDVVRGQPRLVVGDVAYPLVRGITRLGRGTDADIRVVDPGASRNHCEIVIGTPVLLRDTGSTNGTFVDGKRVTEITIDDGTEILIGSTSLTFKNS
jgi:hypothetical protein